MTCDHAIVRVVPVDDAELTRRLAALEAEVKADADAQAARKAEVIAKIRAQEAAKSAAKPAPKPAPKPVAVARRDEPEEDDVRSRVDTAMMVAKGAKLANKAQKELTKPLKQGDKSWLMSAGLSLLFGPVGWLYAGSFREAIPGAFLYILAAGILSKLPMFLVWPVMMIGLPLSAIAGLVYALQYNKHGKRMRLWDRKSESEKKQLPPKT
jgi:hypothetical protein